MFSIWMNLDLDKCLIYLAFISTIFSKSDLNSILELLFTSYTCKYLISFMKVEVIINYDICANCTNNIENDKRSKFC